MLNADAEADADDKYFNAMHSNAGALERVLDWERINMLASIINLGVFATNSILACYF